MSKNRCPVNETIRLLTDTLSGNRLTLPRSRRLAEEILELLSDVAWGRGGGDHLAAIETLAGELGQDAAAAAKETAKAIETAVSDHREVFVSHVETHNCATGDCVRLAPAPCQMTCPAGIDVPTYVSLIGMGRDAEAIEVIRRDNPFPWVCGLVCTRPCELMCVRGRIDTPVSIKFLKAYAAENALSERQYVNPEKAPDKGRRVCVVGAGPAGMSAAYYLALKGYGVRVIESLPMAGGMMMIGIPRYRLPREVIDREVAMLADLGVEFQFDTRFGVDVTIDALRREGFDAFFVAIGAHRSFSLGIPGEDDFPQVTEAIDFLRRVALGDRRLPGKRVLVIGGGNVAIDAARTSLRLGADEVTIAYRRTRNEMPADVEEVEQAEEEGVRLSFLTIPVAVTGEHDRATGISCVRAEMKDSGTGGRMRPVPVKGSDFFLAADRIIPAIGQRVEHECLSSVEGVQWTRRGTLEVDLVNMQTAEKDVFAAGDMVTGPATVVEAIGGGKRAAEAIDRYLMGIPQPTMPPVPVRRGRIEWLEVPAATKMILRRPEMPLLNIERRRTTFQQVELGYSENMVREEARRCLRCDICLRCGKCIEICRDKMGINALQMGYFDFHHPVATDFRLTEERCILCGACAANCPNDAIRIEDRGGERILTLCGTILNRQKLEVCESCGAVLGPARYLDFIHDKVQSVADGGVNRHLCDACSRRGSARFSADQLPVT